MKLRLFSLALLVSVTSLAQTSKKYQNAQAQTHLCGSITLSDLKEDPYSEWYKKNYNSFELSDKPTKWAKKLKDTEVEIYLGTWCGDSKKWVPQFVKLWEDLGLNKEQLKFIALYDGTEKYKQGPSGEEKGKNIHRVPTFIFKKNNSEYARIVESPSSALETDLAQIALGFPSQPNYKAATYLMELLESKSIEEIYENLRTHANTAYRLAGKSGELNTLGYVYLRSGRVKEAITIFEFNTYFFRTNPNVFDSYAEALAEDGQTEKAIENYDKVLALDPENENASKQIKSLKDLVSEG
ncbi:MAG: hypothetical protein JXR03_17070 [Cyclobacteriaceae bacterium]